MAVLANTELTNTFNKWRLDTNATTDRVRSITHSTDNGRIVLSGNVEVNTSDFVVDTVGNRVSIGSYVAGHEDFRFVVESNVPNKGAGYFKNSGANGWGVEIGSYDAGSETDLVFNGNAVVASNSSLTFTLDSTAGAAGWRWMTGATSTRTGTAGATERMRLRGTDGHLGIGTSTPSTTLHVVGDTTLNGTTDLIGSPAFKINGVTVTSTATELNILSGFTGTIVTTDQTQTLTNKTLTLPKINENVILSATSTELNLLDGVTGTLVTEAGTQTLTNKTLTSPNMTTPQISGVTITATATELNYNDISTLGQVQASKTVTADGSGNVHWGDNEHAYFGTSDDLDIYHSGSHSYIEEQGTGSLYIQSTSGDVFIRTNTIENALWADQDGAVTLYHNNSAKFATSSGGATVTGTLISDNITVNDTIITERAYSNPYDSVTAISWTGGYTINMLWSNNFHLLLDTGGTFNNPASMASAIGQIGTIRLQRSGSSTITAISFGTYWYFPGGTVPDIATDLNTATNRAGYLDYYVASSTEIRANWSGWVAIT